jgi:hypothetical protein
MSRDLPQNLLNELIQENEQDDEEIERIRDIDSEEEVGEEDDDDENSQVFVQWFGFSLLCITLKHTKDQTTCRFLLM